MIIAGAILATLGALLMFALIFWGNKQDHRILPWVAIPLTLIGALLVKWGQP